MARRHLALVGQHYKLAPQALYELIIEREFDSLDHQWTGRTVKGEVGIGGQVEPGVESRDEVAVHGQVDLRVGAVLGLVVELHVDDTSRKRTTRLVLFQKECDIRLAR